MLIASNCPTWGEREGGTYGHDEGVAHAGDGVGDLVAELDVVVVEPASGDGRGAVEAGDARLREEASKNVANQTANSVGCEDLWIVTRLETCRSSKS